MAKTRTKTEKLAKVKPLKKLTKGRKRHAGRNSSGRMTVRHRGGGHKRKYRDIDFKRLKKQVPAKVEHIEYDPYRTAFIARILFADGERSYIIAPQSLKEGNKVITSEKAPLEPGNRTVLKRIPIGYFVYNVELNPGKGGQLGRSAGTAIQILSNEEKYTQLKMPSGEIRKVLSEGWATIGEVSNPHHNLMNDRKAGRSRWKGRRPSVRGSAMNPVDHPYGGGEGRTQRGIKRPKTKWGKVTGGRKTRKSKKKSNRLIVKRRKPKRRK
ncbi:MAG: 50S ribosomal protein L2 [Candidatus Paceibacterota bacterium]